MVARYVNSEQEVVLPVPQHLEGNLSELAVNPVEVDEDLSLRGEPSMRRHDREPQ